MVLQKVEGTKVRGCTYHLNLRIPAELQSEYRGETHLRWSLKTSDYREAIRQVTLEQAKLIEASERARRLASVEDLVAALPPEQRQVYKRAGGLEALLKAHSQDVEWLEDSRQYDFEPEDSSAIGVWIAAEAKAEFEREVAWYEEMARLRCKTLRALGRPVDIPGEVFGLRELFVVYIKAKAYERQTAEAMAGVVERFVELHGDLPLHQLTIAHLREYDEAIKALPAVTSSKRLRGQKLPDLLRIAEAEELPPVGAKTRAMVENG